MVGCKYICWTNGWDSVVKKKKKSLAQRVQELLFGGFFMHLDHSNTRKLGKLCAKMFIFPGISLSTPLSRNHVCTYLYSADKSPLLICS
jgi:hypothetical protein